MRVLIIVLITRAAIDVFESNPTEKTLSKRGQNRNEGSIPFTRSAPLSGPRSGGLEPESARLPVAASATREQAAGTLAGHGGSSRQDDSIQEARVARSDIDEALLEDDLLPREDDEENLESDLARNEDDEAFLDTRLLRTEARRLAREIGLPAQDVFPLESRAGPTNFPRLPGDELLG